MRFLLLDYIIWGLGTCLSADGPSITREFIQNTSPNKRFQIERPIVIENKNETFDNLNKGLYSQTKCQDLGGALINLTILVESYDKANFTYAKNCSLARCERGDPRGCLDFGFLHTRISNEFFINEMIAKDYFTKACDMKLGQGCFELGKSEEGFGFEKSQLSYVRGCDLAHLQSCERAGEIFLKEGSVEKAVSYLKKSCSGQVKSIRPSPLTMNQRSFIRFGCMRLAEIALQEKDEVSFIFFAKLQCNDGIPQFPNYPCAKAGQWLYSVGKKEEAYSYLMKGCSKIAMDEKIINDTCKLLSKYPGSSESDR